MSGRVPRRRFRAPPRGAVLPRRPLAPGRAQAARGQLAWAAALLAGALAARVLLELAPTSFHLWLGTSCAAFLGAVSLGAAVVLARHDDAGAAR